MPGETENVAKMAELISEEIFFPFGWESPGTTGENFPCCKTEEHKADKSHLMHPMDVVFKYEDPFNDFTNYLHTDLKSFSTGSITQHKLAPAIRELAKSVECANVSETWRDRHTLEGEAYRVNGLLFIYNHDEGFDKSFASVLRKTGIRTLTLPPKYRIYVIGPHKISYLKNILVDIEREKGKGNLPPGEGEEFYYPDRVRRLPRQSSSKIGRLELLLGRIQVVPFDFIDAKKNQKKGYNIYYEGAGESQQEFEFLIDFCFRNQLVKDDYHLSIRMPNAGDEAGHRFHAAKKSFRQQFYNLKEIENRLDQIDYARIDTLVTKFSTIEIGMNKRKFSK